MNTNPDKLRDEIIEAEKHQTDFLKWKVIILAALASVSLGIGSQKETASDPSVTRWLLCLIPLVCAYIDMNYLHIVLRVFTIGSFLRKQGDPYEVEMYRIRQNPKARNETNSLNFELTALHSSSLKTNVGLSTLGVALVWRYTRLALRGTQKEHRGVVCDSGWNWVWFEHLAYCAFKYRLKAIANEFDATQNPLEHD